MDPSAHHRTDVLLSKSTELMKRLDEGAKQTNAQIKTAHKHVDDSKEILWRARTRTGPRSTPVCPFCGLPITFPHGSDAECVMALREQIDARKRKG
jgi:hypothetical protein